MRIAAKWELSIGLLPGLCASPRALRGFRMPALAARDQEPHRRRDDQPEPVQVQAHRDWQEQARGPCLVRTQRAPVAVQVPVHQVRDDRHAHEEEERDPQDAVPKVQRPALAVRLREVPSQ